MTTGHRCDPLTSVHGGPITHARVLRIITAGLEAEDVDQIGFREDIQQNVLQVLREVAGCARCLTAMLMTTAGMVLERTPRDPAVVAALDLQLADALDALAQEGDS